MKKIFSFVAMMLLVCAGAMAQDKKGVAVEELTYNSSIGTNWVEVLRNNIISGITATGRVNVVDVKSLSSLPTVKEERMGALAEAGVDAVLSGHFNSLKSALDKDGKYWTCTANYTLTLTDVGGAVIATTPYENSWLVGDNSTDAINKCLEKTVKDMKKFVDDNFKAEATIKQLDQVDAKKGVKTAYVTIGSNAGIAAGQMFDIFEEVEIAGEKATKQIGDAKAQEVVSGTLTLVKINKGGVAVKEAFDAGHKITVVSRAKKDPFGGLLK
ncbi:MAG: hypothetical protein IJ841_09395 [Prevotella sp.]|nr:hypothetical protein [Prevotella sp.]